MCLGCCASACIGACCQACGASCGSGNSKAASLCARIHSLVLLILGTVVAFVLEVFASKLNNWPYGTNYGACPTATLSLCLAKEVALRICFGMTVFFFFMLLLSLGAIRQTSGIMVIVQTNGWALKGFLFFLCLVGAYFLPPGFGPVWIWFCQFGGGFFLLAQVVVLLDWAHAWNKSWVEKAESDDEHHKWWLGGLIAVSVVLGLAWLAEVIVMYVMWSCSLTYALTTVSAALSLILLALALKLPRGSLLEVSLVGAYCAYLCISSFLSFPSEWKCLNYIDTSASQSVWSTVISFVITLGALGYSSFSLGSSLASNGSSPSSSSSSSADAPPPLPSAGPAAVEMEPTKDSSYKKMEEGKADEKDEESSEDEYYPYWRFNLIMFLATLYVGCLLTGWSLGDNSTQTMSVGSGVVAMWVKQGTQWVVMLLYLWTLVAPYILVNREFD